MNVPKILIRSTAVNERVIRTKDGRTITFREQKAALDDGGDFPQPFVINLEDRQGPYAVGEYQVNPSSFYVDGKFNKLTLGRLQLDPIKPAARAAA